MKEKPEINPVTWLEKKVLEQDIEIERLREHNERLLAANRNLQAWYDSSRADAARLREALKDLLDATDQWVFQESYPLAVEKAKASLKEDE